MSENIVIAGTGMTQFGKQPNKTVRTLAEDAVQQALADAGIEAKDVETCFFSNAAAGLITGQEMIRGQAALRRTGLLGIPLFNVENACASAASAFHLAWLSVLSGQYEIALAVGSEKLTHEDKTRAFKAIATGVDLEDMAELTRRLDSTKTTKSDEKEGQSRSFFMDVYASMTREYMKASGATAADFADIAVKNHDHGALNPKAQYRDRVTRQEVLSAREIAPPLTLLMCSPIGDGAAAAVIMSERMAKKLGVRRPVRIRASVLISGRDHAPDEPGVVERAATKAYRVAGIEPRDAQVIEVHDATAPAELMVYEDLLLCARGEGPTLLRSGQTKLGGKNVVNPSGGLLSKGHPIGATGIAQIIEISDQLRGRAGARQVEGAKLGMTENGGGYLGPDAAAMSVNVFSI
jgi:acetyl-CoA acetyltransferase